MAIQVKTQTIFGEDREVYIRLNSIEASNHGASAQALFRGYLSQEAFRSGAHYVWELQVEFTPDVSLPLWPQAYAALRDQAGYDSAVDV